MTVWIINIITSAILCIACVWLVTSLSSLPPLTCWQTENETPRHYIYSNNTVRLYLQYYEHHLFCQLYTGILYCKYYAVHSPFFRVKMEESIIDFVRPKFYDRPTGLRVRKWLCPTNILITVGRS